MGGTSELDGNGLEVVLADLVVGDGRLQARERVMNYLRTSDEALDLAIAASLCPNPICGQGDPFDYFHHAIESTTS